MRQEVFDRAAQWLHQRGAFAPDMMDEEPLADLVRETYGVLREGMAAGVADNIVPPAMARKLDNSVFLFSGFKTAQQLKEASTLLRRRDGTVKGFSEFLTDVRRIDANYNVRYLEAEYNFAVSSAQMAASWAEVEREGDRYDLRYRTAGDSHVREEHRPLNGVTLPPSDEFWRYYYPPNGWGCRCTAVQVRKGKYPTSDAGQAMEAGRRTTDTPKKRIFRFNPGIDGQLFPPKHPYYKLSKAEAEQVEQTVGKIAQAVEKTAELPTVNIAELISGKRVTYDNIGNVMTEHARLFPEDYNGGLLQVVLTRSNGAFMSNGRYVHRPGNILTVHNHTFRLRRGNDIEQFNPAREVRDAFQAIVNGQTLTFNQEYAMESLWHETLHAKAKGLANHVRPAEITIIQMETVNQFVARHTYPQFIERFGGKAAHMESVLKEGYGYGRYVTNFRAILDHYHIDETETVEALKTPLLDEPYEMVGQATIKYLKSKGVKNADELMQHLSDSVAQFTARIND